MPTVVLSAFNVANFPDGGGHSWVYLQYVLGLRQLGCDVYWLEGFRTEGQTKRETAALATFRARTEAYGLGGKLALYLTNGKNDLSPAWPTEYLVMSRDEAEALYERADLLLNFHYAINPSLLARFRRTALVDIDPGLLQLWISGGQLRVPPHDLYLTIGETVGTPGARFPDCGLAWFRIRPPVCLDHWPYTYDPACRRFTTVSSWLGPEYVMEGERVLYENTKRVAFLPFAELPVRT